MSLVFTKKRSKITSRSVREFKKGKTERRRKNVNRNQYHQHLKQVKTANLETFRISEVLFSLWSEEEIKRVAPVIIDDPGLSGANTLGDSRLGDQNKNDRSKMCTGCDMFNCSGHFGRIKLNSFQYNPMYFSDIINILRSVCNDCGTLLIDSETITRSNSKFNFFMEFNGRQRLREIANYIKSSSQSFPCPGGLRACACCTQEICEFHSCMINPKFESTESKKTLEIKVRRFEDKVFLLPIEKVLKTLKMISDEDAKILGFSRGSRPESMVMQSLLVPPPITRPNSILDGVPRTDKLTQKYQQIINANNKNEYKVVTKRLTELFYGDGGTNGNVTFPGLMTMLGTKDGYFRKFGLGGRVNFSMRGVAGPADPTLKFGEVGIPSFAAKDLTVPIIVNHRNISEVQSLQNAGKLSYHIKSHLGNPGPVKKHSNIKVGDTVGRFLRNGDVVLVSRQPVISKYSIMAMTARLNDSEIVLKKDKKTIKIHLSTTTPFNCDFDGDEINVHVPQKELDRREAERIMHVRKCIISDYTGRPTMGLVMDAVTGGFVLTRFDDFELGVDEFREIISEFKEKKQLEDLTERLEYFNIPTTGRRAIFSSLFPSDFDYQDEKGKIIISSGIYLGDHIDINRNLLKRDSALTFSLNKKYSSSRINNLLTDAKRAFKLFLSNKNLRGFRLKKEDFDTIISDLSRKEQLVTLNERLKKYNIPSGSNKALFSALLPADFLFRQQGLDIRDGVLISGSIKKKHVGPGGSIIHRLHEDFKYGPDFAADFIDDSTRAFNRFIGKRGFTISMSDCIEGGEDVKKEVFRTVELTKTRAENLMEDLESLLPSEKSWRQKEILATLKAGSNPGSQISGLLSVYNSISIMNKETGGGAKGSSFNTSRIMGILGSQLYAGNVPIADISEGKRRLPHFDYNSTEPESIGYCTHSFWDGLTPEETHFHFIGSREGLIDTAQQTRNFGYLGRIMNNAYENCVVSADGSIRGANGIIIQFAWGGSGLGPTHTFPVSNEKGALATFIDVGLEMEKINFEYGWVKKLTK